jgi:hypothetical protein
MSQQIHLPLISSVLYPFSCKIHLPSEASILNSCPLVIMLSYPCYHSPTKLKLRNFNCLHSLQPVSRRRLERSDRNSREFLWGKLSFQPMSKYSSARIPAMFRVKPLAEASVVGESVQGGAERDTKIFQLRVYPEYI